MSKEKTQSVVLSIVILIFLILLGEGLTSTGERNKKNLTEYEQLMGLSEPQAHVPGPV